MFAADFMTNDDWEREADLRAEADDEFYRELAMDAHAAHQHDDVRVPGCDFCDEDTDE